MKKRVSSLVALAAAFGLQIASASPAPLPQRYIPVFAPATSSGGAASFRPHYRYRPLRSSAAVSQRRGIQSRYFRMRPVSNFRPRGTPPGIVGYPRVNLPPVSYRSPAYLSGRQGYAGRPSSFPSRPRVMPVQQPYPHPFAAAGYPLPPSRWAYSPSQGRPYSVAPRAYRRAPPVRPYASATAQGLYSGQRAMARFAPGKYRFRPVARHFQRRATGPEMARRVPGNRGMGQRQVVPPRYSFRPVTGWGHPTSRLRGVTMNRPQIRFKQPRFSGYQPVYRFRPDNRFAARNFFSPTNSPGYRRMTRPSMQTGVQRGYLPVRNLSWRPLDNAPPVKERLEYPRLTGLQDTAFRYEDQMAQYSLQ